MEFYANALKIRVTVNKLMASPTIVPKAYRFLNAVPTLETAKNMVYNITRADSFYPNTQQNVDCRKYYYTMAIADCEQLCLDLQCLVDMGLPININRLKPLVDMIEREIALLKGARQKVKLIVRGNGTIQ